MINLSGCNVENCSYGGAICAERTAVVKAVSEGFRKFKSIAISRYMDVYYKTFSDSEDFILPCGICRQFLAEVYIKSI